MGEMELKQLTNVRLIEVGLSLSTKEDVIRHLVRPGSRYYIK
jgi:2-O-A-mannosyl-D-glycerate-specific PTS system IIC component